MRLRSNFFFAVVLCDLLIFPYLQSIIISASLVLIIFSFLFFGIKIYADNDLVYIVIILSCASLSTFVSLVRPETNNFAVDNVKYLLQFMTAFLYFFAFKWYGRQAWCSEKFIIYPLYIFVCWYLYLIYAYFNSPSDTIDFIQSIYGRTTVPISDFENDLRYPYLFSDANTAIYFYLMAVSFLFYLRPNYLHFGLLLFSGGVAAFASQSTGGIGAWSLMLVVSYVTLARNSVSRKSLFFMTGLFAFSIIGIWIFIWIFLSSADNFRFILDVALDRLFDEDRNKSGGGRLYHWGNLFAMYPLPLGRGYILYDEGVIKPPHSDLFGLIYRYGIISSLSYIIFLFINKKRLTIFSIAALMPFLINALIDDQKLFGLYLAFLGYASSVHNVSKETLNKSSVRGELVGGLACEKRIS